MDVRENYVMQKESRKEKSICPNCIHHNLCIAENNQPCFECNRFIDANGVTVQEWIPVTERLPECEGSYIVYTERGSIYASRFYTEKRFPSGYVREARWSQKGKVKVTHWMPLPSTEGLK